MSHRQRTPMSDWCFEINALGMRSGQSVFFDLGHPEVSRDPAWDVAPPWPPLWSRALRFLRRNRTSESLPMFASPKPSEGLPSGSVALMCQVYHP